MDELISYIESELQLASFGANINAHMNRAYGAIEFYIMFNPEDHEKAWGLWINKYRDLFDKM